MMESRKIAIKGGITEPTMLVTFIITCLSHLLMGYLKENYRNHDFSNFYHYLLSHLLMTNLKDISFRKVKLFGQSRKGKLSGQNVA